jgi:hypothetical protein
MAREIGVGTILIKDDALLPKGLRVESEPYVQGWKVVTDLDGNRLDRAVEKTGWTYFCLAGEVKATVFGIDSQSMIRRAIERILARGKSDGFNSMEITQVAAVGSERFPLVRCVTLSARWRHIQESLFLGCGTNLSKPPRKNVLASERTIPRDEAPLSQDRPAHSGAVSIGSR